MTIKQKNKKHILMCINFKYIASISGVSHICFIPEIQFIHVYKLHDSLVYHCIDSVDIFIYLCFFAQGDTIYSCAVTVFVNR